MNPVTFRLLARILSASVRLLGLGFLCRILEVTVFFELSRSIATMSATVKLEVCISSENENYKT